MRDHIMNNGKDHTKAWFMLLIIFGMILYPFPRAPAPLRTTADSKNMSRLFPAHSPDNSFIGFVAGAAQKTSEKSIKYTKKNMALVYGKQDMFWIVSTSSLKVEQYRTYDPEIF